MEAEVIENFLELVISYVVPILELIGVFIVTYGSIHSFIDYLRGGLRANNTQLKLDLAETLALSLEFKMAGEILKTVVTRTLQELSILGAVILLRAVLTFLIHWEIRMEHQSAAEHEAAREAEEKRHRDEDEASHKF